MKDYPFDQTPDLSTSFHPQPKVIREKKKPKPMKKIGRKTQEWEDIRKTLKQEFEEMGITTCELQLEDCWHNTSLTFAHFAKRRKLTKQDLTQVALLCTPCHQEIETLPADQMQFLIKGIIKAR